MNKDAQLIRFVDCAIQYFDESRIYLDKQEMNIKFWNEMSSVVSYLRRDKIRNKTGARRSRQKAKEVSNRASSPQFMNGKRMPEDSANRTMLKNSAKSQPYPCLNCGLSYSHPSGTSRNKRLKHSSMIPSFYMCERCFVFFQRKDNLNADIRNLHWNS